MQISRMSMALVAGALFIGTFVAVGALQRAVLGIADDRMPMGAGLAVSLAALWIADRYDLMAPSQTPPVVDLYEKDEEPRAPEDER